MTSGCRISGLTSSAGPAAHAAPMCGRIGKRCKVKFCTPLRFAGDVGRHALPLPCHHLRRYRHACLCVPRCPGAVDRMIVRARSRCAESATDPSCQKRLVDSVSWTCAPPLVPGRSRQRGTRIPLRSKSEILRSASAPSTRLCNGRSKPVLDRASSGPRQRRQALPHLPPKSLYIRATTGQMTASARWLRQHSKAHHLRPHRRD